MAPFVVVLGIVGALLILAGLVGGDFTLSGSFMPRVGMPKIGNWVRLPCFAVGAVLVVAAIVLGFGNMPNASGPSRSPAPVAVTTSASPATSATKVSSSVVATGIVMTPSGYSTLYVHEQPSLSSSAVAQLSDGASIGILCTAQGEVVTNTDTGQSSSLWDGTTDGYVPDVFVDTGTNQATMGSC
jgi:hypothetical protein